MDVIPLSIDEFDGNLVCSKVQPIAAEIAVCTFSPKGSSFDFCWQVVSDAVVEEDFLSYRVSGFGWYVQG